MILRPFVAAFVLCTTNTVAFRFGFQQILDQAVHAPEGLLPIPIGGDDRSPDIGRKGEELEFTLRHIYHHGTHKYPGLHRRLDVFPDTVQIQQEDGHKIPVSPLKARSTMTRIERMVDRTPSTIDQILDTGRMTGQTVELASDQWTVDDVRGPNVTDKDSVLTFAKMTQDAYVTDPSKPEWMPVEGGFNYTEDFGWELDGLRGHIFADTTNKTIVVAMKGTSVAVFDGSETTTNDKENDNLFFSCCCGQGGHYLWRQVCSCQTDTYTCNSTCLVGALQEKNRYYYAAQDLYRNVTQLYPDSDVWLAGHSLGGAVSSLLGMTYGLPVITYEAVPEALPAKRLHLPTPAGYHIGAHQERALTGIHHFGHTADPIFMGSCNGASSLCTIAGYAMESQCHAGKRCVYDTVGDLGWRVGLGTHKIVSVIKDVIEKYPNVPVCESEPECTDCYNWNFKESNGSETTTTSSTSTSTSTSQTRTETCKTPGWWGCLDKTTTTDATTTSTTSTTSTSTSTCKTPGWFGCNDPTTTTTSSSTSSSSSTTCETPGWFGGCNDPTTTSEITTTTAEIVITPAPTITTIPPSASWASTTRTKATPTSSCVQRHWWGKCAEWGHDPLEI